MLCLASGVASADINDLNTYKLGCPSGATCAGVLGANAASQAALNDDNFRVFAREFAAGLTSANLEPPSSLGQSGFAFDADLSIVDFNPAAKAGGGGTANNSTDCPSGQSCFIMPTQNGNFSGPLLIPSVHIRKGLPWSFEVGARVGWIENSGLFDGTIEAKWAVNEGFAYLPDIGIRGYATRLFNSRDFDLTAAGLDLGIGKRFPIGGMITLTPYAGWNLVWVAADSNIIDFQPSRTQQEAEASSTAQLNNTGVYSQLAAGPNEHNRFYGGVRFVGGVIQIIGELSYSVLGGFTDGSGNKVSMPGLLAVNVSFGLNF